MNHGNQCATIPKNICNTQDPLLIYFPVKHPFFDIVLCLLRVSIPATVLCPQHGAAIRDFRFGAELWFLGIIFFSDTMLVCR